MSACAHPDRLLAQLLGVSLPRSKLGAVGLVVVVVGSIAIRIFFGLATDADVRGVIQLHFDRSRVLRFAHRNTLALGRANFASRFGWSGGSFRRSLQINELGMSAIAERLALLAAFGVSTRADPNGRLAQFLGVSLERAELRAMLLVVLLMASITVRKILRLTAVADVFGFFEFHLDWARVLRIPHRGARAISSTNLLRRTRHVFVYW